MKESQKKNNDAYEIISKFKPNYDVSNNNNDIISKSTEKYNVSIDLEVELKKAKAQENTEKDNCIRLVSILN